MPDAPRPPKDEAEALLWLQLIRTPRIGPVTFYKLLDRYGSADAALEALPEVTANAGLTGHKVTEPDQVAREYEAGKASGAQLLAIGGPGYPEALRDLDTAPPLIWVMGNTALLERPAIAMVGARNASSLGLRMARGLAKGLSEAGEVVVSGLARGIDAAAHEVALPGGTIGVLAGGLDVRYPRENAKLQDQIAREGLLVTEQPFGMHPQARHFPRRNRLIAGLSRGLVVVEAAIKSGSLITAQDALDLGRDVMAVPGHPFDGRSGGANQLIRDGATLVRSANDILEAAPRRSAPVIEDAPAPQITPTPPPQDVRAAILAHLTSAPLAEDQLIRDVPHPAPAVTAVLIELEMQGTVERTSGGLLSLNSLQTA